jgi:hypothetical protein
VDEILGQINSVVRTRRRRRQPPPAAPAAAEHAARCRPHAPQLLLLHQRATARRSRK